MNRLTPNQMALLLPATIFAHQLEEYFGGFPQWYSELLNAQLSNHDFIVINSIGLFIFTLLGLSYFTYKSNIILVALGTLVFVNGMAHLLLSIFTFTYSPGTVTGVMFFLPLGAVIYKRILPLMQEGERVLAVAVGILVLVGVGIVAVNV